MNDFMKDEQLTMRQINNFENYYACQNGMIYNSKTHKYCNPMNDSKNGRDFVFLIKNDKTEVHYIDELIAEAFIEKPGENFFVVHKQNIYENQYYTLSWCVENAAGKARTMEKQIQKDVDREVENQSVVQIEKPSALKTQQAKPAQKTRKPRAKKTQQKDEQKEQ